MPTMTFGAAELQVLGQAALLKGLSADAIREVVGAARRVSVAAGDVLFREGRSAEAVFLLFAGRVKLLQTTPEGQVVVLRVIGPGEPLGLGATLERSSYPATATALEPVTGARWSGQALHALMEAHPRIALNALPVLIGRLHEAQEQFRELATERVERRLARVIVRLAGQTGRKVEEGVRIGIPLGRQDLAEMAGTTLFSASRILRRWEDAGIIRSARRQLVVRRPHALVAIAEDLPERGDGPDR